MRRNRLVRTWEKYFRNFAIALAPFSVMLFESYVIISHLSFLRNDSLQTQSSIRSKWQFFAFWKHSPVISTPIRYNSSKHFHEHNSGKSSAIFSSRTFGHFETERKLSVSDKYGGTKERSETEVWSNANLRRNFVFRRIFLSEFESN